MLIKLLSAGLAVMFFFNFTCLLSCQKMEDLAPKQYGKWDNNYIYRGNGRAKTTGEDYEQLVKTVTIGQDIYSVLECVDFEIEEEDIYMILVCEDLTQETGNEAQQYMNDLEKIFCLIKYNIQKKTQQLLTTDKVVIYDNKEYFYRPYFIHGIFDNFIVLRAYVQKEDTSENILKRNLCANYTIDFNANIINPDIQYSTDWKWASKEYLIKSNYNSENNCDELYYRTKQFSDPILVYQKERDGTFSEYYNWDYIEQNDVSGILIKDYIRKGSIDSQPQLKTIKFYNFSTNIMSDAISIGKYAQFYGNNNFIKTYNCKTIDYFETFFETKSVKVEIDNMVYRLVFDENGVHLENFLDLAEEHNYKIYGVLHDKIVYEDRYYTNSQGCSVGGSKYNYYEHDIVNKIKTEIDFEKLILLEDEYISVYERQEGQKVGKYIYFLHEEDVYAGMGTTSIVYLLNRYDTETTTIETMQLWHSEEGHYNNEVTVKYCDKLWYICDNNGTFNFFEFAVYPY